MSSEEPTNTERALVDIFSQYNDLILEYEEVIDDALDDNLNKLDEVPPYRVLGEVFEDIFSNAIEDESEAENLAAAILYCARYWRDVGGDVSNNVDSRELVKFLSHLNVKYEGELEDAQLRESDGPNYWKRLETELVRRSSHRIGLNHRFTSSNEERLDLSFRPNRHIDFVERLLYAQLNVIHEFGEEGVQQTDWSRIDDLYDVLDMMYEQKDAFLDNSEPDDQESETDEPDSE